MVIGTFHLMMLGPHDIFSCRRIAWIIFFKHMQNQTTNEV